MTALLALESTLISHGLPYPQNLDTARRLEQIAREHGADPREGVGVGESEIEGLAAAHGEASHRAIRLV